MAICLNVNGMDQEFDRAGQADPVSGSGEAVGEPVGRRSAHEAGAGRILAVGEPRQIRSGEIGGVSIGLAASVGASEPVQVPGGGLGCHENQTVAAGSIGSAARSGGTGCAV